MLNLFELQMDANVCNHILSFIKCICRFLLYWFFNEQKFYQFIRFYYVSGLIQLWIIITDNLKLGVFPQLTLEEEYLQ